MITYLLLFSITGSLKFYCILSQHCHTMINVQCNFSDNLLINGKNQYCTLQIFYLHHFVNKNDVKLLVQLNVLLHSNTTNTMYTCKQ